MADGNSSNYQNGADHSADAPELSFHAVIGEGDQVLLTAGSVHGKTALPLSGKQAAHLGRALLTASVALRAGSSRPAPGTPVEDCHFPVMRWTTARSNLNGLPLIAIEVPGGVTLTFQLDDQTVSRCAESLVRLAQTPATPDDR
ncbi:hypothetical protein [Pseudochelatococcus contaminans]|uniref:Uncharacterized protein n=1 Tax=Pseudochelatococcus contaminans TaxID=1538103 RepID=A0A7W6EEG4_9HYPH|nr:hypothetical protein [Pseudochelatococcus contaminans]MBB3808130.1 hypothetical protein [Pseudochelatococcus contaminans]